LFRLGYFLGRKEAYQADKFVDRHTVCKAFGHHRIWQQGLVLYIGGLDTDDDADILEDWFGEILASPYLPGKLAGQHESLRNHRATPLIVELPG
jgi:hypothetical protein